MPNHPQRSGLDQLMMIFAIMCGISGWLWLKGPATNSAQLLFRVAVSLIGIGGLIVVGVMKANRKKN